MKPCTQNSYVNGKNGKFAAASKLLMGMGKFLQGEIKGQANAVYTVMQALFEALTIKPDDYGGPRALLVLAGLPGVGKTELVNQIAKYLGLPYGRFDMSSYSDKDEGLFNFKGINESYKASKTGDVTKFVEENPNAILLFDELDKAHAKVLNVFYQMLEGGFIEDACMRKNVSFKNTIVFVTTNVGEELFLDVGRCNYATLPQSKLIAALRNEISPITNSPCFSPALVSRFTKGKIIPFNRLSGNTLCQIAEVNASKSRDLFCSRYPDVALRLAEKDLAKTLVLEKVNQADARNISSSVDSFLGRHLFQAMQDYEEDGGDFAELSEIELCFDFDDCDGAVKALLQPSEKCVAAVYCSEEERSAFAGFDGMEIRFVEFDEPVDSLEYDCAIVSVDLAKNVRATDYFRRIKKQEDLPVYVFSLSDDCRENDMAFYYCGGAENAFVPKAAKETGGTFFDFLNGISEEINFLGTFIELSRANKILRSTTRCFYTRENEGVKMTVKTGNYRLERVMFAEDDNDAATVHEIPDKRFSDVKGLDSILTEASDILEILKDPKKYLRRGVKLPGGLLREEFSAFDRRCNEEMRALVADGQISRSQAIELVNERLDRANRQADGYGQAVYQTLLDAIGVLTDDGFNVFKREVTDGE